ncbi:FG-GAP-like repeat-containing protein [Silvibacterium sp.]|uniref:FG-GAP-like repeat-containing protein n=1 Tax=Silvibacterium sp. TaxID=1964179 RepID=UPI0039E2F68F
MSKKLRHFFALHLAAFAGIAAAATTPTRLIPPHPTSVTTVQKTAPLKARTPMQKIFLPQIAQRMKAVSAKSAQNAVSDAITSMASSGLTVPNFGGYLTPAYVPARLESSCNVDPYNCGVSAVLTADYDKDGKPDAAVVLNDGTLNILLNNGSGSFAAIASYTNPNYSSTEVEQSFAADVNNDGYTDIVVFDAENNLLLTYLNLKNGTFSSPIQTSLNSNYGQIGSIAIGDVNGDGIPDAVTVASDFNQPSNVTVQSYLGTGSGTFANATTALTQTVSVPATVEFTANYGITLGDINKDGKLDIALEFEEYLTQSSGQIVVSVSTGNGDGTFSAINANDPITVPVAPIPGFPFLIVTSAGVQITDLNGDGNPDLIADSMDTAGDTNIYAVLGEGNGSFGTVTETPNAGSASQYVYADVTGDGVPDMILSDGPLSIWPGKGDGTFTHPGQGSLYVQDATGIQGLALADFNGDGFTDIASLGGDYKQLSLYTGNGKGSFDGADTMVSSLDTLQSPFDIDLEDAIDVQGKGVTSPIFVDENGAIESALSDGKGNFTYKVGLTASQLTNLGYVQPVQADFNGDGLQDLLIAGSDGSASVAFSNGDGTFQAPVSLGLPALSCELTYAAAGDLNGDGATDIVITYPGDAGCGSTGSNASGYFVILNAGSGKFNAPVFTAYGTELYSAAISDVNLDGMPDLILNDEPFQVGGTFAVDVLPGNGDGTFGAGTSVNTNYAVSQVIAGDYNQDGKPDLILLTEGEVTDTDAYVTAGALLLPGNGDLTFGAPSQIGNDNFFLSGLLTDVNGDGIPDLVLALYNTPGQPKTYYGLATLLGEGGGAFAPPVNTLESLDSENVFQGSFYSDNAPDFIVQTGYGAALYLGQGGTNLALTSSASSSTFGSSVTLTATISAAMSSRPTPTGSISFYDGSTLLETVGISSGTATFSSSALAVGSHSFTAVYTGDSNFNPATSSATAVAVSALTPAFSLSAGSTTLSVTRGQTGVVTLALAANETFSGAVSLACSGAPADSTCSVSPSSVTLTGGGQATATLVVTTTTAKSALETPAGPLSSPFTSGALSLAALAGLFIGRKTRRRFLGMLSLLVLLISGAAGLTGCGDTPVNTATKGSYTITVTATPPSNMGSAQTATVKMTIQ